MPGDVYILGAGASRSDTELNKIPLPLATDFFTTPYLDEYWRDSFDDSPFWESALGGVLQKHFGLRRSLETSSKPNVEEVYSFLNRVLTTYSATGQLNGIGHIRVAREELLRFLWRAVYYPDHKGSSNDLHEFLAASLKTTDSIISFNWDLLLDDALEKSQQGRALLASFQSLLSPYPQVDPSSEVTDGAFKRLHGAWLLKLHGAVNLLLCTNSDCPYSHVPLRFSEFDAEDMVAWPCFACGSGMEPFLVPPDINKSYHGKRLLKLQASIAANKVATASRLIVIGYSFPVFDFEAAVMFRLARAPWFWPSGLHTHLTEVVIVNPQVAEDTYVDRVKDLLGLTHPKESHGRDVNLTLHLTVQDYLSAERQVKLRLD